MARPIEVKTGDKYGKLTIQEELPRFRFKTGESVRYFRCQCECGVIKDILLPSLRSGAIVSCGCYGKARRLESHTSHGKSQSKEYQAWMNMKARCYNPKSPKYYNYGARGITVCDRWLESFENFYSDMGDRPSTNHSLDRNDSLGNYDPDNCRWATQREQCNNTRANRLITYNGKTQTCSEWDRELGFKTSTISRRLEKGWSEEKAVTTPYMAAKGNPKEIIAMNYTTKTLTVYPSMEECARDLDISIRTIADFIKHRVDKTKPSRGHLFAYMNDRKWLVELRDTLLADGSLD